MSKIITYKEGAYSQIKLDSGERILLSVAQTGIVIFKMRFFGVIPGPKLAEWPPDLLSRFMLLFGGAPLNQTPFNYTVEKLTSFDSIKSLSAFLAREPNPFELARQERALKEIRGESKKEE
jgi:hypothetical protein